jgi:hypothetical protein
MANRDLGWVNMRLVTWNCAMALNRKFAALLCLRPDLATTGTYEDWCVRLKRPCSDRARPRMEAALQAYAQRRLFPPAAWDRGLSRLASQADATAA